MAPRAADVDPVRSEPLLGHHDRVEAHAAACTVTPPHSFRAPAARSQSGRWTASQRAPSVAPASSSAAHVNSTSRRRPGIGSDRGVASRGPGFAGEALDDTELERDHALHVDRPTAVDVAVVDVRGERVVRPALRGGRDDVEVRHQQEGLIARALSSETDMHRAATGYRFDDLGDQPDPGEPVGDVLRRAALAVGQARFRRIDGRDPDQLTQ